MHVCIVVALQPSIRRDPQKLPESKSTRTEVKVLIYALSTRSTTAPSPYKPTRVAVFYQYPLSDDSSECRPREQGEHMVRPSVLYKLRSFKGRYKEWVWTPGTALCSMLSYGLKSSFMSKVRLSTPYWSSMSPTDPMSCP